MIQAHLISEKITSSSQDAFTLYEKSRFGEKAKGKIEYSMLEALFLISENKMEIHAKNKKITEEQLLKKIKSKDKKADVKFSVFSDLRKKGYIVKTALKFGAEFRVYEKGVSPDEDHARWILYAVHESDKMNWYDFAAKNRVAHSTKKNLLIAIVDDELDVTYYEIAWIRT